MAALAADDGLGMDLSWRSFLPNFMDLAALHSCILILWSTSNTLQAN